MQSFLIKPNWPAPNHISAFSSSRLGGFSQAPYDSLNLASHVGDNATSVDKNRQELARRLQLPSTPLWLSQQHTNRVVHFNHESLTQDKPLIADASYTQTSSKVCVVMTADCLPILLCDKKGEWVAAVHAGWRGLAGGILQHTIARYGDDYGQLIAWIGPAIGPRQFEVGQEVHQQFVEQNADWEKFFEPTMQTHYNCDLIGICKDILTKLNITTYGGHWCSYSDKQFYSYRRDGNTGRMASLIWINNA
ncbi:MAG: peptidoglycan editing factor PgeF [Enterobacterales bacterium]|nr:peptidoglycan editing factor PgeF [Enterobacterales bacterium]